MKYCTVLKMLEDLTTVYFLGYERLGGSIAQEKASTVGRTWAEGSSHPLGVERSETL